MAGTNIVIALLLLCLSAGVAALDMDGPLRQGGLLQGRVPPGAEVRALGHEVPVDAEGRFVIGLGRNAPETVTITVIHTDGGRQQQTMRVARRDYAIQRIDGLDRNQVSPDSKTLERIGRDAAAVRSARSERLPARHFEAGWIWPLTGPVSGVYGSQRILNGEPRQPHYGIDIARPTGTPVRAPSDGVVTLAAKDLFFSGGTLILDHGQGLSSSFLHLSAMRVERGDRVRQGQVVAEVGATGRVTGPHLDWRMNWFDQRIDPSMLVPPMQEARSE